MGMAGRRCFGCVYLSLVFLVLGDFFFVVLVVLKLKEWGFVFVLNVLFAVGNGCILIFLV
jgi:hypothetical protein